MDVGPALTAIAAIVELSKAVANAKIDNEVKQKATELNDSILTLQGTLFSLQSENQELLKIKNEFEAKLINLANWQQEAQRYKLCELCSGVLVYALKEDHQDSEPMHYICPNCYENNRKSILQSRGMGYDGTEYVCKNPECGATFNNFDQFHTFDIT